MTWRRRVSNISQRHAKIISEKSALLDGAAGEVNGAAKHLLDRQLLQNSLEIAPRTRQTLERAGRSQRSVPYEEIQRQRADGRPLESGRDDPRARLEMADDVGERLGRAHYVVREMKQRRVGR